MLLLSIKPRYVEKIRSGEKRVELRRRKPRSQPADWLAIYECAPTMALVAIAQVVEVRVSSPPCLWRNVRSIAGVTKKEFDAYFAGSDQAIGIEIQTPLELSAPILLDELRAAWPRFNPPQGFVYLSDIQQELIIERLRLGDDVTKAA
jgi:predicted transcriptional regulator